MRDDAYYAEIEILIDDWLWNTSEAPARERAVHEFPSAQRLLDAWDAEASPRAA